MQQLNEREKTCSCKKEKSKKEAEEKRVNKGSWCILWK
jgi:hypothetical protein